MHDFEVQIPVTSYYHAMNIINIISNYRQRSPTKKVGSNLWTITQIYKRYWHRYDLGEKENNFFLLIQVIAKIVFMICKKISMWYSICFHSWKSKNSIRYHSKCIRNFRAVRNFVILMYKHEKSVSDDIIHIVKTKKWMNVVEL